MSFTIGGYSFSYSTDPNGNVVTFNYPMIGPLQPGTVAYDPGVPLGTAQAYAQFLVDTFAPGA